MDKDPFYLLKEKTRVLATEVNDFLDSPSLDKKAVDENFSKLSKCEGYLKDLKLALKAIESNRARFTHIDNDELKNRQTFVTDMVAMTNEQHDRLKDLEGRIEDMAPEMSRNALLDPVVPGDKYRATSSSNRPVGHARPSEQVRDADGLTQEEGEILDDMAGALSRLGGVAQTMTVEIKSHGAGIDRLDEGMDTAQGRFDLAMARMDKLMGKSNAGRYTCIVVLTIIVCIELVFIIY